MKVIVPCCGRSSRFPNLPPKWMLPAADGRPMICAAVAGLNCRPADLIVTILREHETTFDVTHGLELAFGSPVRTCILEQRTGSQSETVAKTLQSVGLNEPFLVKDSDGSFALDEVNATTNYVCVDTLNNHDLMNPRNKSYVRIDDVGCITLIREKVVISDLFNVGGYFFRSPAEFLHYYENIRQAPDRELYLSVVIDAMLNDGQTFEIRRVRDYHDWGTLGDWRRALSNQATAFVPLDGFLFEEGNAFFHPRYDAVATNSAAVDAVRAILADGVRVVFTTPRPVAWKTTTEQQLREAGLPDSPIVFHCPTDNRLYIQRPDEVAAGRAKMIEIAGSDPELHIRLQRLLATRAS